MYFPGTRLKLKAPRSVPAVAEDKEKKIKAQKAEPFAYDEVEVVGQSPVSHSAGTGWDGVDGQGVILRPLTAFGGLIDEPFGKVMSLYEVTYEPDPNDPGLAPQKPKLGPSPEDQFKREAGNVPQSPTRVKTPHSPL